MPCKYLLIGSIPISSTKIVGMWSEWSKAPDFESGNYNTGSNPVIPAKICSRTFRVKRTAFQADEEGSSPFKSTRLIAVVTQW